MAKAKKPEECAYFSIKNFEIYQHYKNRNPPWVKLHYAILDDEGFLGLDLVSQRHLMVLFMVAGKQDNRIYNDPTYLKRVLRLDAPPNLTPLFYSGWLLASSASVPRHKQKAKCLSEAEADNSEAKAEADSSEAEESERQPIKRQTQWPKDFMLTEKLRHRAEAYWQKKGVSLDVETAWDKFQSNHLAKGSLFLDWEQAWQTWYVNQIDYAKANHNGQSRSGYKTNIERLRENTIKTLEGLRDD